MLGIVPNFSSSIPFEVDCHLEDEVVMYDLLVIELMKMIDDLLYQNLIPSLPLGTSVSLLAVFVGVAVYISVLPPIMTCSVCKVSKSFELAALLIV